MIAIWIPGILKNECRSDREKWSDEDRCRRLSGEADGEPGTFEASYCCHPTNCWNSNL